ncbi:hypothetical protein CI102_9013 [Trichoderma harzianum]|nr:hypothetical protein CI102_9013 [Trichoderma harzianum]
MEELFGRQFQSPEEARAAIDAVAQPLGYNFVKHRVRPNSIEFRCSKGRTYKAQRDANFPSSAHSRYRNKALEKKMDKVMSYYELGLRPIQILGQLQSEHENDPELQGLTRHDIYNAIRKHRQQEELDKPTEKE